MNTNIIDQLPGQNSTNQNLTHYYTDMSLGHYKVIGDTYYKETTNTRAEYINMGYKRGQINRQILEQMDSYINFSLYDKWDKLGTFDHDWGPDGEVDMIWMVYRNIGEDMPNPGYTAWQLGFGDFFNGVYRKWSGEASLGGGGILSVDGGLRTIDLGGYGLVSGVTIMYGYNGLGAVKNIIVHEFGHHLIGGTEAHFSHAGLWGMMGGYASRSLMVNSYERHRLGWINFMQYNYNPLLPIPLDDFLTSDEALRIEIPGSNPARYYLLENHQRQSVFDNIDRTSDGKGIYVIYQSGPDENDLEFYNAEGRSIWGYDHCATHPIVGVLVPVFLEGIQDPINGKFDTEAISHPDCVTGFIKSSPIEAYISAITGQDVFEPLFRGDGKDMLNPGYMEVFNPVSNPSIENLSFYVITENNQLKIRQYAETGTIYDGPPSKPQNLQIAWYENHPKLTWDSNLEPDVISGGSYEIYRAIEEGGLWGAYWKAATVPHVSGSNQQWTDNAVTKSGKFDPHYNYRYKIAAVDYPGGLKSVLSDYKFINGGNGGFVWKHASDGETQSENDLTFRLYDAYPNPFNPTTTISYSLKKNGLTSLKVYDILGNEVVNLVYEKETAGNYSVEFNAEQLPSGMYIYRITSGNFTTSKKLILMK